MADPSASIHTQVAILNDHIDEFNDFAAPAVSDSFRSVHFLGSINPHRAEAALIDHWDEFLQFSRRVLNTDTLPRERALEHVDLINLAYKRSLSAIQAVPHN